MKPRENPAGRRPRRGWILLPLLGIPMLLRAGNPDAMSLTVRVDPPPRSVRDLTARSGDLLTPDPAAAGAVTLTWTEPDPVDPGGNIPAGYEVRYSSTANIEDDAAFSAAAVFPQSWTPAPAGSPRAELVTGLAPGVTYYWALKAVDGNGGRGSWDRGVPGDGINDDNFAPASLPLGAADALAPRAPAGLWADAAAAGGGVSVTLHWSAPGRNADGTALTDLAGYHVYRSTLLAAAGISISSPTGTSFTDAVAAGTVRYYRLRAFDTHGNESLDSAVVEASGDGSLLNVIFRADDAASRVSLPTALARQLLSQSNGLGEDLVVEGARIVGEEGNGVARSVSFRALRADSGGAAPGFFFRPPLADVVLGYDVVGGQVMQGGSPLMPASDVQRGLAVYWFNGVEWIKAGGAADPVNNTISLRTAQLGRYQARRAPRGPDGPVRVYPRTFTPNGDGWNDKAVFAFDNPDRLSVEGRIYDDRGGLVASLSPGPSENTLTWDGRCGGRLVPGGVYFYRLTIGGQVKEGHVVVAR